MRLSRANLRVAGVASADKTDPSINRVHVTAAGETVATDGRAVMAVEPVDPERAARFPDVEPAEDAPGKYGVGLSLGSVRDAERLMPRDKRPSLGYVQITECNARWVELVTTDGARKRKVADLPMRGEFPEWRGAVASALAGTRVRVCVDRRALVRLLQALDKAAPDPGGRSPVFLELSGDGRPIVARVFNNSTNQRAVGLMKPLKVEGGKWLRRNAWEEGLAGGTDADAVSVRVVGGDKRGV